MSGDLVMNMQIYAFYRSLYNLVYRIGDDDDDDDYVFASVKIYFSAYQQFFDVIIIIIYKLLLFLTLFISFMTRSLHH